MGRANISFSDRNRALVMNVPVDLDNEYLSGLPGTTLRFMDQFQAAGLVVDASQMLTMESLFVDVIMEIADRVNCLGKRMVIAGMKPTVTRKAEHFGLDFDKVISTMYVDLALDLLEAIKAPRG